MARKRLLAAVLCVAMVAGVFVGGRAARPHATPTTVRAAALATREAVAERAAPERASRSASWARDQIEQLPLEDFAPSSTTAAPRRVTTTVRPRVTARATSSTEGPTTTKVRPATTTTAAPKAAASSSSGNTQSGKASYYDAAPAGTCAHRTLPKGTIVTVTRVSTGASIQCRVADRGPYAGGFIIDLAKSDFARLAPVSEGVIEVRLTW